MLGIGGTGVVTVNQIISTAAFLENKKVVALDQTGLSQKGGSVVSHLKILQPKFYYHWCKTFVLMTFL